MVKYSKFKDLLEERDVSSYAVSKATGISQSVLSDWKNGKSIPKLDKIHRLADYFGVSTSYFEDGESSRKEVEQDAESLFIKAINSYMDSEDKKYAIWDKAPAPVKHPYKCHLLGTVLQMSEDQAKKVIDFFKMAGDTFDSFPQSDSAESLQPSEKSEK